MRPIVGNILRAKKDVGFSLTDVGRRAWEFFSERIIFEFTEGEPLADHEQLIWVIRNYREMGFRTAIDDFGKFKVGSAAGAQAQESRPPAHHCATGRSVRRAIGSRCTAGADRAADATICSAIPGAATGRQLHALI